MLNTKELVRILEIVKGVHTPEGKEIRLTIVRLLSGVSGVTREIEFESLKVQLRNLLDL